MWPFKKKIEIDFDLSWLGTDMHSHLVPGIDDGSPDLETSLRLITELQLLGYKKLITTPHILWDIYPNTHDDIVRASEGLKEEIERSNTNIEFECAAEYFLDEHFDELLKANVPLLSFGRNYVLVEFSMITAPFDLQSTIFELQMRDYKPIIAHPERYVYLNSNREFYHQLKEAGCSFQVNLLSLIGYYGKSVMELAEYLVKNNLYEFAGTDLHHERHISALKKLSESSLLQRLQESGQIKNTNL